MKPWKVILEEVKITLEDVNGTSPRITYYCKNQPVISRVGNVLTFHVSGDFATMGHAVNCVGDILMWTDWCQIPVCTAKNWLYRIANVNDLRTYQIKPGLEIDVTTNKTNGEPAPANEKRAERVLQQKYLTRNPLKTTRHNGKTYHLILDLHDPSQYLATDRRQECFVIFDDHSEITALIASATLKKLHKAFRYDDGLRDLLRNAKPSKHGFCCFLKSHDWIRKRASPQLQKLLALWLLTHDVEGQ
jgi:hypothetical protein